MLQKTTRHKETETQSEGAALGSNSDLKALLTQFAKALGSMAEEVGSRMCWNIECHTKKFVSSPSY